jgi:DNA polymerase-3 subunit delta'
MSDDAPHAMSDDADATAERQWAPLPPWLASPASAALARRARWPHALLVTGPEGIGKRRLAAHFARSLLCETPRDDGSACGTCESCRYVGAGQHPDLFAVEPVEFDEDGNATPVDVIKIDAIRRLIDWTQVTSHRRRAKVAVIAPAEAMHYAAANALLKTLEEPPAGTFLLLVSHRPGRLPATIASRCRRLVVPMPSAEEASAWLAASGVADAAAALAQAGGAPMRARALADPSLQAERAAWMAALAKPEALSAVALAARIELAPRDERRDRLAAAIDWLIAWTADLARIAVGGEARRNPDRRRELAALASRVARISLFRYHRTLLRQRALVTHPLQPRLVAEALLIEYRTLFEPSDGRTTG